MQNHITPRRRVIPAKAGTETLVLTGPAKLNVHRGRLIIEDGYANLGTNRMLELEPPLTVQSVIILTNAGWWSMAPFQWNGRRLLRCSPVTGFRSIRLGRTERFTGS